MSTTNYRIMQDGKELNIENISIQFASPEFDALLNDLRDVTDSEIWQGKILDFISSRPSIRKTIITVSSEVK